MVQSQVKKQARVGSENYSWYYYARVKINQE